MNRKDSKFFWPSFTDLMTSLFFIMLVLYVLTFTRQKVLISQLNKTNVELVDRNEALEKIIQIDRQFQPLIASGKFKYYPESKKFVANDLIGKEIFDPNKTTILPQFIDSTLDVGKEVENLLKTLSSENSEFSYQLVIEGNMANRYDYSISRDNELGYKLSYERALAVYNLWNQSGINLRKYNTEILIAGSGFNGIDRDPHEENNKRFSIQIIPKISPPEQIKEN